MVPMKQSWCLFFSCLILTGLACAQTESPIVEFEEDVDLEEPVVLKIGAVLPNGKDAEALRQGYELFSESSGIPALQIKWLDESTSRIRFDFVSVEGGGRKSNHYNRVIELFEGERVDFLMGSLPKYACGEAGLAATKKIINVQSCTDPVGEFQCNFPAFWLRTTVNDVVGPAVRSMVLQGMHRLGLIYDGKNAHAKKACADKVQRLVRELGDVDEGLKLMVEERLDTNNEGEDAFGKFARDCRDKNVEAVVACCEKEDCSHVLSALHKIK